MNSTNESQPLVSAEQKKHILEHVLAVNDYNSKAGSSPVVLVCGSRDWEDAAIVESRILALPRTAVVISGAACGVDTHAARVANHAGLRMIEVIPDWDRFGKRAGWLRNLAMADFNPDLVIAFQKGNSKGTQQMIDESLKRGFAVVVYKDDGSVQEYEARETDFRHGHTHDEGRLCYCGEVLKPELCDLAVENGTLVYRPAMTEEAGKAAGFCPFCGEDLEKCDTVCKCGNLIIRHDPAESQSDPLGFGRACEECGSPIVKGRCDCGLHQGDVVEEEVQQMPKGVMVLGFDRNGPFTYEEWLYQHCEGCMCDGCRKDRLLTKLAEDEMFGEPWRTIPGLHPDWD